MSETIAEMVAKSISQYKMDYSLYKNSLGLALTLMIFFAIYFFVAKTPDKPIFANYKRSRRIIGTALLVLSANYSVHLFDGLRFQSQDAAILMNLSTYFLSYWLFSASLITLLDRTHITLKRTVRNLISWVVFTLLSCFILFVLPRGICRYIGLTTMAVWLFGYGIYLSRRIIRTYHEAVRMFDDTHSENIAAYIRWMSIFTWWAIIYGVSCGLLTFLPDEYVYLWILSSVPFYIYLYCAYMNYLLFYEQVETILESPAPKEEAEPIVSPTCYPVIERNLPAWLEQKGFTSPGITIGDTAVALGTNRTYLAAYIKQTYSMPFREWIAGLRIELAKTMLASNPELSVGEVCEATGFLSQSYFVKIFTKREGVSPSKWKKQNVADESAQ